MQICPLCNNRRKHRGKKHRAQPDHVDDSYHQLPYLYARAVRVTGVYKGGLEQLPVLDHRHPPAAASIAQDHDCFDWARAHEQ